MSEEMQALMGQENLESPQAVPDALPEKFRGKSVDEIVDMYRNLEADYGRKGQLLGKYQQRLSQLEAPEADAPEDDPALQAQAVRCQPAAEAEYQRLLALGMPESEDTQTQAWSFAMQQDSYLQQAIAQGVQAQLLPLTQAMAPGVFGVDVQTVLHAAPVQGVSADELVAQISQAGIPAHEWATADPRQKSAFIVAAAKQLAYDKLASGQLAPTALNPVAPAQPAPGLLNYQHGAPGMADPAFAAQVQHLADTMGLSRDAAEEVLRG